MPILRVIFYSYGLMKRTTSSKSSDLEAILNCLKAKLILSSLYWFKMVGNFASFPIYLLQII